VRKEKRENKPCQVRSKKIEEEGKKIEKKEGGKSEKDLV